MNRDCHLIWENYNKKEIKPFFELKSYPKHCVILRFDYKPELYSNFENYKKFLGKEGLSSQEVDTHFGFECGTLDQAVDIQFNGEPLYQEFWKEKRELSYKFKNNSSRDEFIRFVSEEYPNIFTIFKT